MDKFEDIFGRRFELLGRQILAVSALGHTCDVTFFRRKPAIGVTLDEGLALAVMSGTGPAKFYDMLQTIRLSNGAVVNMKDIWTINLMPSAGFTQEELEAVDMSQAEEKVGANGATLRKMIKDTYHCKSKEEEDHFLRRFIAS